MPSQLSQGDPVPGASLDRLLLAQGMSAPISVGRSPAGSATGLDPASVLHKTEVQRALALHQAHLADPYEVLHCLGGNAGA